MPRVSIGLPVYNGERFLGAALESLLGQTFGDLEIVVCDNASTDATEEIARAFADRDPRVRVFRNPHNLGAAANFNRAFALARGEYFKWAAHDDLCAPDFVEACAAVLDQDPSVVLCHAEVQFIDAEGRVVRDYRARLEGAASPNPAARFRAVTALSHWCFDIFGLIRAETLARTPLIAPFIASDRNLLAELSLYGRFHRIPRVLFFSRDHADRSIRALDLHERARWFDPARPNARVFPYFRQLGEYGRSVLRVPLPPGQRLRCLAILVPWMRYHRRFLKQDLLRALRSPRVA